MPAVNYIGEDEIKSMRVNMLVNTGSVYMSINENILEQLQLPVLEQFKGQLANGKIVGYDVAGPIEVNLKQKMFCRCYGITGRQ